MKYTFLFFIICGGKKGVPPPWSVLLPIKYNDIKMRHVYIIINIKIGGKSYGKVYS